MTNPSGIKPTEFNVLIEPKPVEEKTKGGIILADVSKEREKFAGVEGMIIATGPGAFTYMTEDEWAGAKPKTGDRILLAKFAGAWRRGKDGREYLIIKDKDVVATLEE